MTRSHPSSALVALALLTACVPAGPPTSALDDAPGLDPHIVDAAIARQRDHLAALHELRARVDAADTQADCDTLTAFDPDAHSPPELALADAWCRLRARDHQGALASASIAAPRFEHSSRWRRAIEASVLATLAAEALSDPSMTSWRDRAERILLDSDEPLVGPADDPLAGDLPYLAARASHVGLPLTTRRPMRRDDLPERLDADTLYLLASREYLSFSRPIARAHAERGRALLAMDRGDLPTAAHRLSALVAEDASRSDTRPLHSDLSVWVRLARASGDARTADSVDEWLFSHAPLASTRRARSWADFPSRPQELARHLLSAPARDDLVARIRTVRRDSRSAIAPPRGMLHSLSNLEHLGALSGDGWRLALEAGELFAEHGHHRQARRYLEQAVTSLEGLRASLGSLESRARMTRAGRRAYLSTIHGVVGVDTANLTQADYALSLAYASAIKARGLSDLLDGAPPPEPTRATPPIDDATPAATVARHTLTALELLGRRPSDSSPPAPLIPVSPPSLPEDTIALEYVIGERAGYVWASHGGVFTARRISGRRTLGPLLESFRETLVDEHLTRDEIARHRALSERLYVELIGPVDDLLVRADALVIAPDGPLHHLPFEALARPRKSGAAPDYLITRHAVSYVPSMAILSKLQSRSRPSGATGSLVMGAPDLEQAGVELWPLANALPHDGIFHLRELFPELPGVRREMRAAERALSRRGAVTTWRGPQASEAALRVSDLSRFRFLHLGTHGLSDAPPWRDTTDALELIQPALLLSRQPDTPDDGILTLSELLNYRTAADLVVLSGCTTGRGWAILGDGSYGLAGAFLATGSSAVIASTWSVADHATGKLMGLMYRHLAAGASPSQALRRAQLGLIRSGRPFTPPFFWASFRLVGLASANP